MSERSARVSERSWPEQSWEVRRVVTTASTNADLLADPSAGDRVALVADHQTAGRGRLDRTWESPPGANLLVSLKFRPASPIAGAALARRVGVAAVDAIAATTGVAALLKWPNDVLVEGDKVAGVLAQGGADGAVVVGIGVNVGWAPPGAARLAGTTPAVLLTALLAAFDALPVDAEVFHDRYRAALVTIGQRVRVELPAGELLGVAADVTPDGTLVVRDPSGRAHQVTVGDVVHLRPAD